VRRFVLGVIEIVVASLIVNWLLVGWDGLHYGIPAPRMSEPVSPVTMLPTRVPVPTSTPAPPAGTQIIYVFNLSPVRVWFDKADAVGYREAVLEGNPTRPYISLDKSRTVRGGRMFVLKHEDGLIMVKVEGEDVVGWIQ
jgi:hypothetical protein